MIHVERVYDPRGQTKARAPWWIGSGRAVLNGRPCPWMAVCVKSPRLKACDVGSVMTLRNGRSSSAGTSLSWTTHPRSGGRFRRHGCGAMLRYSTAPVATQQGERVRTRNIARQVAGKSPLPFLYHDRGTMVNLWPQHRRDLPGGSRFYAFPGLDVVAGRSYRQPHRLPQPLAGANQLGLGLLYGVGVGGGRRYGGLGIDLVRGGVGGGDHLTYE